MITGVATGTDTVVYTLHGFCGVYSDSSVVSVGEIAHPAISGATSVCVGKTDTLYAVPAGGIWGNANGNTTIYGTPFGLLLVGDTAGNGKIFYSVFGVCGTATDTLSITVFSKAYCDSVNEVPATINLKNGLSVFPNPTLGRLSVRCENSKRMNGISITDLTGRRIPFKVIEQEEDQMMIDLSGQPSGIYLLEVFYDDHSDRVRVMLESN